MKHALCGWNGLILAGALTLLAWGASSCAKKPVAATAVSPATVAVIDMSAKGVDTANLPHSEFLTGSNHSAYSCADCHSAPEAEPANVCAQTGCHPFSRYSGVMTNFDHSADKTGSRCDRCHSSMQAGAAGENPPVAGWRRNSRLSHTEFHAAVQGVCLSCHDVNNIANYPASHKSDPNRQTACENCHYYKNQAGIGKWAGGHPVAVSGCAQTGCHSAPGHYASAPAGPYQCEWCHSNAVNSGYTTWSGWGHNYEDGRGCSACHGRD